MSTIAIIQARLSSTRFPRKVLQPIWNGMNSIDMILARLHMVKFIDRIILATTTNPADDELAEKYKDRAIVFRGSEEDVFDRITMASMKAPNSFPLSDIIEITSDCPFICPEQLIDCINEFKFHNYDYLSNAIIRNFPIGFDFQIYKQWMLSFLNPRIPNINHKIHGGWNLVNYSSILYYISEQLKYGHIHAREDQFHPEWRVVLDYPEDLELLQQVMKRLNTINFTLDDVIQVLNKEPELLEINKNCKQKTPGIDKVKPQIREVL